MSNQPAMTAEQIVAMAIADRTIERRLVKTNKRTSDVLVLVPQWGFRATTLRVSKEVAELLLAA